MELLGGAVLAAVMAVSARLAGFDRERAFFPLLLVVIATYYIVFAAMSGSSAPLLLDGGWAALFPAVAVAGYLSNLLLSRRHKPAAARIVP